MNIENLSNHELLEHYKDAVCDNNYNPNSENYNKSGFTYDELEAEILNNNLKKIWIYENLSLSLLYN